MLDCASALTICFFSLTAGITSLMLSAVVIATPWITELWLLVVVVMVGGICYGYLDAGKVVTIIYLAFVMILPI